MEVKFCGQCGKPLRGEAKFCISCGWKIIGLEQNEQPVQEDVQETNGYTMEMQESGQLQHMPNPVSTPNPGGYSQNAFKEYSRNMGYNQQPNKGKSLGKGIGIALVSVIVLAGIVFLGIKAFEGLGSIGSGSKASSEDLSGTWMCEFTPLDVKVNGKTEAAYAAMIGKSTEMNMVLQLGDDGRGSAKFQGSSYGYDFASAADVEYKNGKIEVTMEDPSQGSNLKYTGKVSKDGEDYAIEGSYETSYEYDGVGGKLELKGTWVAHMSKGTVAKGTNTSNAKKDATLEDLQGIWTGRMEYTEVKNIDKIEEASEEEKEMFKQMVGMELDCSMEFEGSEMVFTITDPTGGTSDLDDLPPITLEDGVFTAALKIEEDDGSGKMNLFGVVTEESGKLAINGEMSMAMSFGGSDEIEFLITYNVTK